MNKFFTHPMRPFFRRCGGACHTRRVGVFHQPRCRHFAPPNLLRTHAACGIRRFLTAAMLEWTGYKGRLKPVATLMAALLLAASAYCPFRRNCLVFVAAYWLVLLLFCSWLMFRTRPKHPDNFALLMLLAAFTAFRRPMPRMAI